MLTFGNESLKNKITEVSNHATTKCLSLPWLLTLQLNYLTVLKDSIRKVKIRGLPNAVTASHFSGIFGKLKLPSALDFSLQKMKQYLRLKQRHKRQAKISGVHPRVSLTRS